MKRKLLINLLLLLVLLASAISLLNAAPSNFCGNGYSCPGEASDVNVPVVIPSTMVFKINGVTAPTDGSIEIGFIYYNSTAPKYWRAMTYDNGEAVGLFWTGTDDGTSMYGDNTQTTERDGFLTDSPIYIYVYDKTNNKFYTITSYKLKDHNGNLVNTFSSGYLYVTLEELNVYTSPVLTNPADNAVSQPLSVNLTWDAINGADSYDLQASANADFSNLLIDMNLTATNRTFSSLSNNTKYYWRVRAIISGSKTEWSDAEFLTQLATPSITSPANSVTNINPANASIGFSTVTGADKYTLTFHPTSGGSDITVDATSSPKTVTNLLPCVEYSLTVQAKNTTTNNTSTSSSAVLFTTLPKAPTLTAPSNVAKNVSLRPTFTWTPDGSCTNKYKISLTEGANTQTYTVTGYANQSHTWASDLKNFTTYTWTVTPINSNNEEGAVSTSRTFTTEVTCATLVSPASDSKGIIPGTDNLVFTQVSGGKKYTVNIFASLGELIESVTVDHVSGQANNQVSMTKILYNYSTTYTWKVTVEDVDGYTKTCGDWKFTTPPAAPVLKSPYDEETNVALNPTMKLEHIGTDYTPVTNFEVTITKADGTPVDSKTINRISGNTTDFVWNAPLSNYTAYKWKARSKTSDGIYSDWTAISDFTTEVACVNLVSPANASKGIIPGTDNLVFTQVSGGKKYTIYIFDPLGELVESVIVNHVAGQTNNQASMTKALYEYSTTYTWEVKIEDVNGNTKSCADWTFTTPPAAPVLKTPANNANNVSIFPAMKLEHIGTDYSPVTKFEVELRKADGTLMETLTINRTAGNTTDFNWLNGVDYFKVYKWKARSLTADGIYSDWTAVSEFTTEVSCAVVIEPEQNTHGFKPASTPFSFYQVDGAAKYTITVKDLSSNVIETKSVNNIGGASTNQIQMTGSYNYATTYTWTLTIEDIYTNTKVCGPFSFDTPPAAPTLNLPANNAKAVAFNPTFQVGHSGTDYNGVTKFNINVTTNSGTQVANFEVNKNSSGTTTNFNISPATTLDPFTTYKWKARSLNSDGVYSDWTAENSFQTEVACPTPTKPTNAQKYVLIGSDIEWSSVSGASTYQLVVSKNSDMTSPLINVTQAGNTYNPSTDFEFRTVYYWTVKVTDVNNNTKTCGPWSFETELDAPRLTWPANNATCIPIQDVNGFQWQTYAGAQKYDLQYSKVNNDWTNAVTKTNLTTTKYAFSGLDRNQTYYWRVQAWVDGVSTGYCGAYTFTTIDKPVVLTYPDDNSCGLSTAVDFTWNAISGTTEYTLQVTKDATFNTIDFNQKTSATHFNITTLSKGTNYFWRVTSDKCGSNDLTEAEIRTFSVIPSAPTLVSPSDNSVDVSTWGDFEFNGVNGADAYYVLVSENSDFSTKDFESYGNDLTPAYNGLNSNTHYFWKVRGYLNCSGTKVFGDWSDVYEFDTKKLGPPQIKSPADASIHNLLALKLEWNAEPNVTYYALQVSKESTFTNSSDMVVDESEVRDLKWDLSGLNYGTTYYWRLRSVISQDTTFEMSGWSKAYSFKTIPKVNIDGPTSVCSVIENTKQYTLEKITGVVYTWTVTGGTIENDGNSTDNEAIITWTTAGTGTIKVVRSGSVWGDFTDNGTLDVNVKAKGTISITTETDTYYDGKYCPNEKIKFIATINDPNIDINDLEEYYWDFGNGNIVSGKLNTEFVWEKPGQYTAKFYARTSAEGCADYTQTLNINVVSDCPVTALLESDNYICNGAPMALFETYVFGGAGGNLKTDYKYSWVPKTSFQNPTEKDGIYLETTRSRYVDFYAYDKNNKSGHLNFKVYLRSRPVPSVTSILRVPYPVDNVDLENGDQDGNYKLLISYGCGGSGQPSCDGWSWNWYDANYNQIEDYNDVDVAPGINAFYLVVTNDNGCNSKMYRGVVYRVRSKEVLDYDFTTGRNETSVMFSYPNPAVNYLNVFAEFEKEASLKCSIINLEGKTVKTYQSINGKIYDSVLDVTDITAGTYFLLVESENDAVVWKFNKQ